ncbi:MAG: 50S ribosomal protein L30e [Candidatus Bilamarchaeaceae archaeon]
MDMEDEVVEKANESVETEAGETPVAEKPGKGKVKSKQKVIRKRKGRKEKENPLAGAIRLAVESGKVEFGSKKGIRNLLLGKPKLVVIAKNSRPGLLSDVARYSAFSDIPLVEFEGTSIELGSICGKPFSVSLLAVYDPGASNIMDFGKKKG